MTNRSGAVPNNKPWKSECRSEGITEDLMPEGKSWCHKSQEEAVVLGIDPSGTDHRVDKGVSPTKRSRKRARTPSKAGKNIQTDINATDCTYRMAGITNYSTICSPISGLVEYCTSNPRRAHIPPSRLCLPIDSQTPCYKPYRALTYPRQLFHRDPPRSGFAGATTSSGFSASPDAGP